MKPQSNKKILPRQWTMWYFFSVMDTDPTSVKNVLLFFSYGDRFINPFNYCMQWNINPKKYLPTSVNNVVLIFSYGDRSHFIEQSGTFSQLWRHITQPLKLLYAVKPQSKKMSSQFSKKCGNFFSYGDKTNFSEQCGTFFSYWDILINPFKYYSSLVPFYTIYSIDILSLCSAAEKDEWNRRKYVILLYLPLKIFTQYWYQSFWYWYQSFLWTDICSGGLYIYRTLPYQYWIFVGTGISLGKQYQYQSLQYLYRSLLYRYRSSVGSFWPL